MSHTTLDPNTLIPLADLPAIFHRSRRTVKRWKDRGVLPSVTVGGTVYVRRADLDAILATPAENDTTEAETRVLLDAEQVAAVRRAVDAALAALTASEPESTDTPSDAA